jgi:hypothetical protein
LCAFVPKVCDDNDPTTTDYCDPVTGECKIAPVVCDDGNACTNEAYDPQTGGCLSLPVSCDDANPCTADSCNPASGCVNAPDDKGACGDNDKCNGIEYCQNGTCMPGEVPVCNNGNLCDVGACHPVNGCQYTPLLCDDGSICTLDSCDPKQGCLAVPDPAACNDQNPCTDDSCDLATGCVHQPNDKNSCGDNDKCNGIEYCQAGACVPGEAPVCDDGNPCTAGKCDPVQGCQYTPDNGGNCSDNNECNGMEFCQAGKCMPGVPLKCDDGNACTTDACTPGKGCGHTAVKDDTPCPGGSNYACLAGKCVCVPDCVGKACGDNGCGGSCGFCQGGSVCDNGQCVAPYTCSDMIACGSNCNFSPSCILGCYGKGSAASIGLFTAYGGCLAIACGLNIDPVCIAAASMGQCKSAYDACMADQ